MNIEGSSELLTVSHSPEAKRVIIAVVRRVVITGLILLFAWLIILAFRGAAPSPPGPFLDWSISPFYRQPIANLISSRLGTTSQLVAMGGLLALVFSAILLSLGTLICRLTERFPWAAPIRTFVRSVLFSGGASM